MPPPPRRPWPGWPTCGPAKTPRTRRPSRSRRRSPPPPAASPPPRCATPAPPWTTPPPLGISHEYLRWAWPLAARAAHDLADTAATRELLALLDGYQPGQLAPMQRAERDLARARLTAAGGDPAAGPAFAAAITGLRQHSTPYHLAHGLLDHAAHLAARGDAEAAAAAIGEAAGIAAAAGLPAAAGPRGHHPARQAAHRGLVITGSAGPPAALPHQARPARR